MKIYEEITIDMNPESNSYGETLSEESYDYDGEVYEMKKVGKAIKKGWNKLTSAVGKVWNKTLGKEGLGKLLGKQKLFGTRLDKLARKITPKFIRNMKSSDWGSLLLSFVGPGALFGKLGGMMNSAGAMWGNAASKLMGGAGKFGQWIGKGMNALQSIGSMGRSIGQGILGMGVNPNAMYGQGWLGNAAKNVANFFGGPGKFGSYLQGAYNPIGMTFKGLTGFGDAITGNAGNFAGAKTGGSVWNPFNFNAGRGQMANALANTTAGTWMAPIGQMTQAGSKFANFFGDYGADYNDAGRWGTRSGVNPDVDRSAMNFGEKLGSLADSGWRQGVETAMNAPGAAVANAMKFAPALTDWADNNPYSDWSNFALGMGEIGGHLYGAATGQDEFKMGEFGEDTGLQPVDETDPSQGVQFGQYPGSDVLAEASIESKGMLDAINAQAMRLKEQGVEDVSAIAGQYQSGLGALRNQIAQNTFGMGYDPNTIADIAGAPEESLYSAVQGAARSKGAGVDQQVGALKQQWDDLMYSPEYVVSDINWDDYNQSEPTPWGA